MQGKEPNSGAAGDRKDDGLLVVNTLDEEFRASMDQAASIERRLSAMKQVAGMRTVCFISRVFPGITDLKEIFWWAQNECDLVWLENLNLRGGFKGENLDYIGQADPHLAPLYHAIYHKGHRNRAIR